MGRAWFSAYFYGARSASGQIQHLTKQVAFHKLGSHTMSSIARHFVCRLIVGCALVSVAVAQVLAAQTCSSGADLDAATKSSIDAAAKQYLDMSKNGDVAGLRTNSIPAIAGDFGAIEQAAISNKPFLAEGSSSITG